MAFQFTFRNLEASPHLEKLAKNKLSDVITKTFDEPISANVSFFLEKGAHCLDVHLLTKNGMEFAVSASAEHMYQTVDLACEKLDSQLRRKKEKLKSHRNLSVAQVDRFLEQRRSLKNRAKQFIDADQVIAFEKGRKAFYEKMMAKAV